MPFLENMRPACVQWQASVKALMNIWIPHKKGINFLNGGVTINFSRKALYFEIRCLTIMDSSADSGFLWLIYFREGALHSLVIGIDWIHSRSGHSAKSVLLLGIKHVFQPTSTQVIN
jgi:hypothetical protein